MRNSLVIKSLLTVVWLFGCVHSTVAQKRVTVLMSTPAKAGVFSFNTKHLPDHMIAGDDDVNLVVPISPGSLDDRNVCYMALINDADKQIAETKITGTSTEIKFNLDYSDIVDYVKYKSALQLTVKQSKECANATIQYKDTDYQSDNYVLNDQPRLVIEYEIEDHLTLSTWSQSGANPQHTNSINWEFSNANFKYKYTKQDKGANLVYDNLLIYSQEGVGNKYTQYNKEKRQIEGMYTYGPLITESDNLITFGNDGSITVFDNDQFSKVVSEVALEESTIEILDPDDGKYDSNNRENLRKYLGVANVKEVSINGEPSIGYDGTVYAPISSKSGRLGVVAASSSGNFVPRWFYNSTHPISTVSLSRDERYVFFVEILGDNSRLVVLDNIDGSVLATSKPILSNYMVDRAYYTPSLPVQTIDGVSYIYILNSHDRSDKLFVFEYQKNSPQTLQPKQVVTSNMNDIQQPIITGDNEVIIHTQGSPYLYDVTSGEKSLLGKKPRADSQAIFNTANRASDEITSETVEEYEYLHAVASNNYLFILYSKKNNQRNDGLLVAYQKKKDGVYDPFIYQLISVENIANYDRMILKPDGSIILGSRYESVMFDPQGMNETKAVGQFSGMGSFIGTQYILAKNSKIGKQSSVIIKANSTSIMKGFELPMGAQLSIKN